MKIVTDSGADLPAAEAKALGITIAPLFIQFPDGEIESSAISPDVFYDRLAAMRPNIPTTAQPSAGIFAELYRQLGTVAHFAGIGRAYRPRYCGGRRCAGETFAGHCARLTML